MFQNARIVCTNADVDNYHTQDARPGDAAFVMSAGTLADFAACPARWIAGYRHGDGTNKKWRQMLTTRHLSPARYPARFAVRPDTYQVRVLVCPSCKSESDARTCRKCGLNRQAQVLERQWAGNADYCKKWAAHAETNKQLVVRVEDDDNCVKACNRLDADPMIAEFIECSDLLVWISAEWKDANTGLVIPTRTLIAYVPRQGTLYDNALASLKTTRDASHGAWRRQCYYAGYHLRAAWSADIYTAATGSARSLFYFIISENIEPYEPARRCLTPTFMQLGRRGYQLMLDSYCACLSNKVWPSYDLLTHGPDAWSLVETEPWMHQGDSTGTSGPASVVPRPVPIDAELTGEAA